ncbi:unnamed protein product [Ectocarpus fasciculatus]
MKVSTFNGGKVYNLSSGKAMPLWLSDRKKRELAKDEEYRRRLELIQDFDMPEASQCLGMTADKEHIIVTGTYPPIIKCFTVADMSMKFQRGLTAEVVAFQSLSEDFGKMVFLQADRTLNFHAPYGTHYSVRVPKFGRDLAYNWNNCDLYVCGAGDEVYRLNLESGQFKEPFTAGFVGINKMSINPLHNLLGFGGESSSCEFVDLRTRKSVSKIRVSPSSGVDVTAFKFDTDGLTLGVGTSDGNCILYDIRSSQPLYTKEHQYGLPIVDVTFHTNGSTRRVISTDSKILKIWERDERAGSTMGKIVTNIEPASNINAVHCVQDKRGDSGLIFMAGDQTRVMSYFAPQLGPAPRWCTYLDSLTEELEENSVENGGSVYEDYKFITKAEVEELGAASLIGTPMLRGYMHGFFIEMKLYAKLRAVSKPFEYEEHRKKKIQEKIEQKRASRITARKRLPKVNAALAEKLMKGKKGDDAAPVDDRFQALFEREEFQQDMETEEYKLRNPTASTGKRRSGNDDSDDELQQDDHAGLDDSGLAPRYVDDEEDGYKKKRTKGKKNKNGDDSDEGEIARVTAKILQKKGLAKKSGSAHKVKMFEVAPGVSQSKVTFGHSEQAKSQRRDEKRIERIPIGDRLQSDPSRGSSATAAVTHESSYVADNGGIVRSLSYMPKSDGKGGKKRTEKNDDMYEDGGASKNRNNSGKRKR